MGPSTVATSAIVSGRAKTTERANLLQDLGPEPAAEGSRIAAEQVDVAPPLERGLALLDRDRERVAPPLRDVLGAKPGLDLRQVGLLERPEADHNCRRRRSESSACSSRTPNARHASP